MSSDRAVQSVGVESEHEALPKRIPISGQSGPPIHLPKVRLSDKERKVVEALANDANSLPINVLAAFCFDGEAKGNSWVRNALRRLVCGGWVERVARGTYRLTEMGATRWVSPDETPDYEAE